MGSRAGKGHSVQRPAAGQQHDLRCAQRAPRLLVKERAMQRQPNDSEPCRPAPVQLLLPGLPLLALAAGIPNSHEGA